MSPWDEFTEGFCELFDPRWLGVFAGIMAWVVLFLGAVYLIVNFLAG